jgi:hypothetical protein
MRFVADYLIFLGASCFGSAFSASVVSVPMSIVLRGGRSCELTLLLEAD